MSLNRKKSKNKFNYKDDFTVDESEDVSICSLSYGEPKIEGKVLRSFSFDSSDELVEVLPDSQSSLNSAATTPKQTINPKPSPAVTELAYDKTNLKSSRKNVALDERNSSGNPNGRTPPVDGEIFDMVRTYTLRRSTVRILSKIKAIHMDDNVYLNTIVDEAIRYYYDHLKSNLK
ncbi:hypothetical protein [Clostridium beijerinckii]|uniref:Uncharacterized protein n=1 Tax=Clostridium beijerinckii TaxID=1520 RepID=A0A1S8RMR3_CLOBE|nr:hypothetical protein [Clostridium beijerinckii]NRY63871.1 hypothetical protein [Clostridium beijerinckii]OOM54511.1 hypothetical protein CLBCK_46510 [Clostridium beijerinckii]